MDSRIIEIGFRLSILWGIVGWSGTAAAQSLHTTSGIEGQAELRSLGEACSFDLAGQLSEVALHDIVRWGAWPGVRRKPAAWLSDGSWIVGSLEWEIDQLTIRSDWLSCSPVDSTLVRGLVLKPPLAIGAWNQLRQEMEQAKGDEDHLWLESGARVLGVLDLNSLSSESEDIVVEVAEKRLELPKQDVQAVVFSPTLVGALPETPQTAQNWLGLKDGSLLRWKQIRTENKRLTFEMAQGLTAQSIDRPTEFARAIRYLAGQPPNMVYLSDLPTAQYQQVSRDQLVWELGVDRDCYQRPLMIPQANGTIGKGLAMHSTSQVAYRHDGSEGRFLAEVVFAMPQSGASTKVGSARCRVLLARDGRLEEVVEAEIRRGLVGGAAAKIDVPVNGSQLIVLRTEALDFGPHGGHVLWLDARVQRD